MLAMQHGKLLQRNAKSLCALSYRWIVKIFQGSHYPHRLHIIFQLLHYEPLAIVKVKNILKQVPGNKCNNLAISFVFVLCIAAECSLSQYMPVAVAKL